MRVWTQASHTTTNQNGFSSQDLHDCKSIMCPMVEKKISIILKGESETSPQDWNVTEESSTNGVDACMQREKFIVMGLDTSDSWD